MVEIVRQYIFGQIGEIGNFKFLSQLTILEKELFGFQVDNILRSDYQQVESPAAITPTKKTKTANIQGDVSIPLEDH